MLLEHRNAYCAHWLSLSSRHAIRLRFSLLLATSDRRHVGHSRNRLQHGPKKQNKQQCSAARCDGIFCKTSIQIFSRTGGKTSSVLVAVRRHASPTSPANCESIDGDVNVQALQGLAVPLRLHRSHEPVTLTSLTVLELPPPDLRCSRKQRTPGGMTLLRK